jgi:hypothetical protein
VARHQLGDPCVEGSSNRSATKARANASSVSGLEDDTEVERSDDPVEQAFQRRRRFAPAGEA